MENLIIKISLSRMISNRILDIWDECDKLSPKDLRYEKLLDEYYELRRLIEKEDIEIPKDIRKRF